VGLFLFTRLLKYIVNNIFFLFFAFLKICFIATSRKYYNCMINFYYNYCIFYTFCIICFLITFLMSSLTHWLSRKIGSSKKASPYECGFNAFSSAHTAFDVHFFVVALLFLVFDIELMFLYP